MGTESVFFSIEKCHRTHKIASHQKGSEANKSKPAQREDTQGEKRVLIEFHGESSLPRLDGKSLSGTINSRKSW